MNDSPIFASSSDSEFEDEDFTHVVMPYAFPRAPRVFQNRADHFVFWRDSDFVNRFRLSKPAVQYLLDKIGRRIRRPTTRNGAVSIEQKLFVALRYYATGCMHKVCSDFVGIHKSTASRIIRLVSHELARLRPKFVHFPVTEEEKDAVVEEFFNISKFPRVMGALDCTHVRILLRSPKSADAELYCNQKRFYFFKVQTVCDANLSIQNIVARWPGSAHDSTIFQNSRLKIRFDSGEFGNRVLLGNSGYPIKSYLMTPIENPQTEAQNLYNESHIRTRNCIERSHRVWKQRFPVLAIGINVNVASPKSIIVATAVLHNIAMHFSEKTPRVIAEEENAINLTLFETIPAPTGGNNADHPRRRGMVQYFHSLQQ